MQLPGGAHTNATALGLGQSVGVGRSDAPIGLINGAGPAVRQSNEQVISGKTAPAVRALRARKERCALESSSCRSRRTITTCPRMPGRVGYRRPRRAEYRGVSAWVRRFGNGSFVLPWETSRDVSMVFVDEQVS